MDSRILMGDQYNECVLVCNPNGVLPDGTHAFTEEWVYHAGVDHIAGVKYRQGTVFGDVILIAAGAGRGKAQMVSCPEGKLLWSTEQAGNNPHCIEILPSGNIAVAASTGGTVRLFQTSALLSGQVERADCYEEVPLLAAHGVLWDPKYGVLWALGDFELNAYRVEGSGAEERLELCSEMSRPLPEDKTGGHALTADLTDSDFLYLTVNHATFRFDKRTLTFVPDFLGWEKVCRTGVKGLVHNGNGDFYLAFARPDGAVGQPWEHMGLASWCANRILYLKKEGDSFSEEELTLSGTRAVYKISAFCGSYL